MEIGDSIELCFYHGIERNENGYWLNYTDYMGLVCCDEMTKEELQNLIDHYDCTLQKLFDLRDKLKNA